MLSSVLRTVRAHKLLETGDLVLVAVSGGPDSMALLHALWELRDRLGIALEVAAVDHGLRAEARAEAELVRERSAALELPFHMVAVDAAAARRQGGASLQDAARRVRLAALAALAARRGARRVALGHQADDQAETVLFRIIRGTGLPGLAGIPYRRDILATPSESPSSIAWSPLGSAERTPLRGGLGTLPGSPTSIIRPLLDVSRAEVLRYLRRRSIPFVEDPSNADLRFARARVRHRILPLLAGENPRVREALVALATAARAAAGKAAGARPPPALDPGINRRAAAVIARLEAARGGTSRVDLAGGRVAEICYGTVSVRSSAAAGRTVAAAPAPPPVPIAGPGAYELPGGATVVVRPGDGPAGAGAAAFDADALRWPLSLRARRPGDRMRPRGGRGSRKVADLLIDAKISRNRRARLPLLTTADDVVLFVPGLRPSELGRPTPTTRRLVHVFVAPA